VSKEAATIIEQNKAGLTSMQASTRHLSCCRCGCPGCCWCRVALLLDAVDHKLYKLDVGIVAIVVKLMDHVAYILQVALGTRAMVLHCAVNECIKQSVGAGRKAAITSTTASLTPLVTDLLLTVQKLRDLGADSLMQPILNQLAADDVSGSKKSTKSSKSASSQA
jgi:hypothetical protein